MRAIGPADSARMQREAAAQVVAIVAGKEVTRGQLLKAFAVVEDPANWKNPIDAVVPDTVMREVGGIPVVTEAVVFFAGCIPSFDRTPDGAGYRVQAIGYYRAVGA